MAQRDALERLREAGVLSALDVHFARTLGRVGGEAEADVLLAAALTSRQIARGHVCLDLDRLVTEGLVLEEGSHVDAEPLPAWPALQGWLQRLARSPLVAGTPVQAPLVLDQAGRLYLSRHYGQEQAVAAFVQARAETMLDAPQLQYLQAQLDRYFPTSPGAERAPQQGLVDEPNLQRQAAQMALERSFCVVSGGPGTGKTFTVVKILALLVEQRLAAGQPAPRMHLMAPTGKAAARLVESIEKAKGKLPCSEEVRAAIPDQAGTIHRALGTYRHGSGFRHNRQTPLLTDVVLVDEASMVDLTLMSRLFDAIPPAARVILLGDKNQLASVEAGAVLGDICGAGRNLDGTKGQSVVARSIVHLTHSYRYDRHSGIGLLAEAINGGDSAAALSLLDDPAHPDITIQALPAPGSLEGGLASCIVDGLRPYLASTTAIERLRSFDGFRVLCAHRRGPMGLQWLNPRIEALLHGRGLLGEPTANYDHRPVMVTRNDYQAQLFNGDVGVIEVREGGTLAHFIGRDGTPRSVAASRLPPHETVFAMSVHKSQGSEFDHVALVLPPSLSPILTRELLYTAVTRARRRVSIFGAEELVRHAVSTPVQRASGLGALLWPR